MSEQTRKAKIMPKQIIASSNCVCKEESNWLFDEEAILFQVKNEEQKISRWKKNFVKKKKKFGFLSNKTIEKKIHFTCINLINDDNLQITSLCYFLQKPKQRKLSLFPTLNV